MAVSSLNSNTPWNTLTRECQRVSEQNKSAVCSASVWSRNFVKIPLPMDCFWRQLLTAWYSLQLLIHVSRFKFPSMQIQWVQLIWRVFLQVHEVLHFVLTLTGLRRCRIQCRSQFISFSSRKWLVILTSSNDVDMENKNFPLYYFPSHTE
jgi:hypothetical protein